MAHRHLARSTVLQTLFELDIRGAFSDVKAAEEALRRNAGEFAPGVTDLSFMRTLVSGVIKKRADIDRIIEKAAPDWPLPKIAAVDRNVLRIGLFELLFADRGEVPAKVAINEAIELAKTFGGETSGKFVNGVLGAVYKELGEPGKEEGPKRKRKKESVPFEKMPIQRLGGAVVFAREGGEVYLAFVHDIFGHWTLSKGKLEGDEAVRDGTIREIQEELGVDITLVEDLGTNEYVASDPEKGKIRKQVHYFLGETKFRNLTLGTSGGLDDARWFRLRDIVDLNFYPDILPIITKAVNLLLEKK